MYLDWRDGTDRPRGSSSLSSESEGVYCFESLDLKVGCRGGGRTGLSVKRYRIGSGRGSCEEFPELIEELLEVLDMPSSEGGGRCVMYTAMEWRCCAVRESEGCVLVVSNDIKELRCN